MSGYVAQYAISAGIISQSNPFTKKKRKPQKPRRFIQVGSFIRKCVLQMRTRHYSKPAREVRKGQLSPIHSMQNFLQ